jgi:hypothetical protein
MSSVSRFLRQRQTGQTNLKYTTGEKLYALLPGAGNYVGNYPNSPVSVTPGWVVDVTSSVNVPAGAFFRDMGKTIFCGVSANTNVAPVAGAQPGFFRAVQLITPGYGTGSATYSPANAFGVGLGMTAGGGSPQLIPFSGNSGDMGYNTFYIPISVGGTLASNAASPFAPLTLTDAGLAVGEQL